MSTEPKSELASAFLAPVSGEMRHAMQRYNEDEAEQQRAFYAMQTPKVREIVDALAALRFDGLRFSMKAGVWFDDQDTVRFRLTTNAALHQSSEINCRWRASDLDASRFPAWTFDIRKAAVKMVTAIAASSASIAPGSAAAWAVVFGETP